MSNGKDFTSITDELNNTVQKLGQYKESISSDLDSISSIISSLGWEGDNATLYKESVENYKKRLKNSTNSLIDIVSDGIKKSEVEITNVQKQIGQRLGNMGMIATSAAGALAGSFLNASNLNESIWNNDNYYITNSQSEGTFEIRRSLDRNSDVFNEFYGKNNIFPEGASTWYANGRAAEILVNQGVDAAEARRALFPMRGGPGNWLEQNKYFATSNDITSPKQGSIVVFSDSKNTGHVAIVENVTYDSNGIPSEVSLSEGGYGLVGGFRFRENISIKELQNYCRSQFQGYIYLLDN